MRRARGNVAAGGCHPARPRLLLAVPAAVALACAGVVVAALPDTGAAPPTVAGPGRTRVALAAESAITFHASDAFGGFDGRVPVAGFSAAVDPQRPTSAQATIVVRTSAITTGNVLRDMNAARAVFEASRFPTIRYTLTAVTSRPASLREARSAAVSVRGRLRMHGVERDVVARGEVSRTEGGLDVRLTLPLRLSDFGMTRPRLFAVVVDDTVDVRVHLVLRLLPAGG